MKKNLITRNLNQKIAYSVFVIFFSFTSITAHSQSFWSLFRTKNITGSGNVITETREVKGFDAISVGSQVQLFVTVGDTYSFEILGDDNILEHITTDVKGNTLEIKADNTNFRKVSQLQAFVTLPEITRVRASGASKVFIETPLDQESVEFRCSGSGKLQANANVNKLTAHTSGASNIILDGNSKKSYLTTSGSSSIKFKTSKHHEYIRGRSSGGSKIYLDTTVDELVLHLSGSARNTINGHAHYLNYTGSGSSRLRGNFSCDVAKVRLSGSSNLNANITKSVSGRMSGSSRINTEGNPETSINTSGSARVNRID